MGPHNWTTVCWFGWFIGKRTQLQLNSFWFTCWCDLYGNRKGMKPGFGPLQEPPARDGLLGHSILIPCISCTDRKCQGACSDPGPPPPGPCPRNPFLSPGKRTSLSFVRKKRKAEEGVPVPILVIGSLKTDQARVTAGKTWDSRQAISKSGRRSVNTHVRS